MMKARRMDYVLSLDATVSGTGANETGFLRGARRRGVGLASAAGFSGALFTAGSIGVVAALAVAVLARRAAGLAAAFTDTFAGAAGLTVADFARTFGSDTFATAGLVAAVAGVFLTAAGFAASGFWAGAAFAADFGVAGALATVSSLVTVAGLAFAFGAARFGADLAATGLPVSPCNVVLPFKAGYIPEKRINCVATCICISTEARQNDTLESHMSNGDLGSYIISLP